MLGSQRVIGDTVGNFEIVSRLGKGGMGEVWLAEQKSIKTKVAIKMLQASISTNTTHVQRFFNEAVAVSQIHHSGIVKIFDVGFHTGGQAYLVMEYLQGETLTSRIKRTGQLSIAQVADFGRQIASVLDATHHAGITHRDLKPDNIYLVDDAELAGGERVKILDFGIAKLEVRSGGGPRMTSLSASSIGTPNYMSPEQWHSLAEVDWHTDAYAFGCVAFEMACGRPPFQAESMTEICAMHLGDPPPVPSKLVPGLPPQFDDLVARLLEKEPAQRPTMREAMTIFTALGQPYAVGQTTLPPGSPPLLPVMPVVPPPPAASQSLPAATSDHADAPIPPVRTPQQVVAKQPRRVGLFVLLAALAIAGTVGAVVISRSSGGGSAAGGAGSGAPADSGSVTALASPTPDSPADTGCRLAGRRGRHQGNTADRADSAPRVTDGPADRRWSRRQHPQAREEVHPTAPHPVGGPHQGPDPARRHRGLGGSHGHPRGQPRPRPRTVHRERDQAGAVPEDRAGRQHHRAVHVLRCALPGLGARSAHAAAIAGRGRLELLPVADGRRPALISSPDDRSG
ncbi:MAG: serine/threonine protein kinase [Deltaproteobacteria bacterium]|nr:serine/threonine protein kinase [Deltaproteobacteria bacterium]